MSAICHATGKIHITDTNDVHDIPCIVVVKVTPAKDGYEAKNEIKGVEPVGGKTTAASSQAPMQAAAPAATPAPAKTPSKMPWQK